jgi:peroxiredoxin
MKWRGLSETAPEPLKASLKEELDERRTLMRRFVPKATQAINDQATNGFRQAGLAKTALKVGDRSPEFTLQDARGNTLSTADLLAQGPLIVTFIRGRWCPFCCATTEVWQGMLPHLKAAGVNLLSITPMSPQQSDFMRNQHKLAFPILSDPGNKVAAQFGVAYRVPQYQQDLFSTVFINLPHINGDDSWTLPLPATFGIATDGIIKFAFADEDYTLRAEPAEVIQALIPFGA